MQVDVRDIGSIPGWGRSPGGGHGKLLQYYCLENPKDRGAWWARATVHGVAKSGTGLKETWPFICVRRVKKKNIGDSFCYFELGLVFRPSVLMQNTILNN